MYVTDLRGLRIISLVKALRMGVVEDALLDPACHCIAALRVHRSAHGAHDYVPRRSVKRVGRHAVIVAGSDEAPEAASTPDDADRLVDLQTLVGLEVVTDEGNLLGHVQDAVVDPDTLAIQAYAVARSPLQRLFWRRAPWLIAANETLSGSRDVLVVPETSATVRDDVGSRHSPGPLAPLSDISPASSLDGHEGVPPSVR